MKNCPQCGTPNLDDARFCSNCAYSAPVNNTAPSLPSKNKGNLKIVLIVLGCLIGSCVLCGIVGGIKESVNPTPKVETVATTPAPTAAAPLNYETPPPVVKVTPIIKDAAPAPGDTSSLPQLQKVKATWTKGGFGSVALWKVTIKNNSNSKLGDIKYSTEYTSETGNVVGRGGAGGLLGKDTIEKIVPPKSTRTFEVNDGFINSEAETASFEIVSWREIP